MHLLERVALRCFSAQYPCDGDTDVTSSLHEQIIKHAEAEPEVTRDWMSSILGRLVHADAAGATDRTA